MSPLQKFYNSPINVFGIWEIAFKGIFLMDIILVVLNNYCDFRVWWFDIRTFPLPSFCSLATSCFNWWICCCTRSLFTFRFFFRWHSGAFIWHGANTWMTCHLLRTKCCDFLTILVIVWIFLINRNAVNSLSVTVIKNVFYHSRQLFDNYFIDKKYLNYIYLYTYTLYTF